MKMRSRRRVLRSSSAKAWVATAAPQPISTQGNQSVSGVSHRLTAAQISGDGDEGREMDQEDAHRQVFEHASPSCCVSGQSTIVL